MVTAAHCVSQKNPQQVIKFFVQHQYCWRKVKIILNQLSRLNEFLLNNFILIYYLTSLLVRFLWSLVIYQHSRGIVQQLRWGKFAMLKELSFIPNIMRPHLKMMSLFCWWVLSVSLQFIVRWTQIFLISMDMNLSHFHEYKSLRPFSTPVWTKLHKFFVHSIVENFVWLHGSNKSSYTRHISIPR